MAEDWSRKFSEPIYPKDSKPIVTLNDARRYLTSLPHELGALPQWSSAIAEVMQAAKGGSVQAARDALWNAVFIDLKFDPKRLSKPDR